MGQGQHRIIIWRNLEVLNQLTLHIMFQANQPSGSGEDVFRLLPYMGMLIMWSRPFKQISDPHIVRMLHMKSDWNWLSGLKGEVIWKCWQTFYQRGLRPRSLKMTLVFGIHRGSHTTYFHITDYQCFGKIQCFAFSPIRSLRDQIWSGWKICQYQSRVTIWTNLVVLSHLIIHTKFQGNQPSGSGEDEFHWMTLAFAGLMLAIAIVAICYKNSKVATKIIRRRKVDFRQKIKVAKAITNLQKCVYLILGFLRCHNHIFRLGIWKFTRTVECHSK